MRTATAMAVSNWDNPDMATKASFARGQLLNRTATHIRCFLGLFLLPHSNVWYQLLDIADFHANRFRVLA